MPKLTRGIAPVQAFDPKAAEKLANNGTRLGSVSVTAADGSTNVAWRKDGQKPIVDDESFKANKHAALPPHGTADFAESHLPKEK